VINDVGAALGRLIVAAGAFATPRHYGIQTIRGGWSAQASAWPVRPCSSTFGLFVIAWSSRYLPGILTFPDGFYGEPRHH